MRVRLAELMKERGMTAYAVAKESDGRVSTSALYRLLRKNGRVQLLDVDLLEALCDVLDVGPGELLERDTGRARRR